MQPPKLQVTDRHCLVGNTFTAREVESKYCLFLFYLFIFSSGGGSVPFIHPRKYAPESPETPTENFWMFHFKI